MLILYVVLILLVNFSPTILTLVWGKFYDAVKVFLLNTAWVLVSLTIYWSTDWMMIVSHILLYISFLMLFQEKEVLDKLEG